MENAEKKYYLQLKNMKLTTLLIKNLKLTTILKTN